MSKAAAVPTPAQRLGLIDRARAWWRRPRKPRPWLRLVAATCYVVMAAVIVADVPGLNTSADPALAAVFLGAALVEVMLWYLRVEMPAWVRYTVLSCLVGLVVVLALV